MSLRDWFAGRALSGLLADESTINQTADELAAHAYELADAMMKERDNG